MLLRVESKVGFSHHTGENDRIRKVREDAERARRERKKRKAILEKEHTEIQSDLDKQTEEAKHIEKIVYEITDGKRRA